MKTTEEQIKEFIELHRGIIHPFINGNYKTQKVYEKGWTDCIKELEKYIEWVITYDQKMIDYMNKLIGK
jgi:fido (protein-threonine AMPylation protein)